MKREHMGIVIIGLMELGFDFQQIADLFNARGVECPYGASWDAMRVQAIAACDFALARI